MQPARFKLHAGERTCSPVQRPNFRGQDRRLVRPMPIPTVSHHQGRAPGLGTKVAVLLPMGEGHQPIFTVVIVTASFFSGCSPEFCGCLPA